jgi:ubiquitin C-terminal hydrolase
MINECKKMNKYNDISQLEKNNENQIKKLNQEYEKKLTKINILYREKIKNFTICDFIDDKDLNSKNYIPKLKTLINYTYLYYKDILDKEIENIKNEEKQLINNNKGKKIIIQNKYQIIDNYYLTYINNINKLWNECFNNMGKILFNNRNIIEQISSTFQDYKNKTENLLVEIKKLTQKESKVLENELTGINISYSNNLKTFNNNKNEINNNLKLISNNSYQVIQNKKMPSQQKILVSKFQLNKENDIDYKKLYNLKEIKGIICYPVGLQNLGNTCFMNSCIQSLRHCFLFANYILNEFQPNHSMKVSYQFKKLMENLFSSRTLTEASDFKRSLGNKVSAYQNYKQNDSSHFFSHLLNTLNNEIISSNPNKNYSKEMHEENNSESSSESPSEDPSDSKSQSSEENSENAEDLKVKNHNLNQIVKLDKNKEREKINKKKTDYFLRNDTKLNRLFIGFMMNETEYCCGHKIQQLISSYNYLNLDIFDNKNFQTLNSLDECFQYYIKDDKLDGDDKVYCSKCKRKVKAISRIKITDLPEILVINLRRVADNNYYSHYVDYLVNLDLSKYLYDSGYNKYSMKYTLKSIIQHYGSDNGGHKVAICRNFSNNKWYYFSDSTVYELDESKIFSYTSHLFFYERCDKFTNIEPEHRLAEKESIYGSNYIIYEEKEEKNKKKNSGWNFWWN